MIALPRMCGVSILLGALVCVLLQAWPAFAQEFVTINFPGATSTGPETINDAGQIVGRYTDSEGVVHGFLLSAGVFTTIDYPGGIFTNAAGINNYGEIVGFYEDSSELFHGFTLNNGTFTSVDDPAYPGATFFIEISDARLIVGNGVDSEGNFHGFTLNNNVFTAITYPGANSTQILDVNYNGSEIVGDYALPSFAENEIAGFTYINGVFASVTYPQTFSTALNGVNNTGQFVGSFLPFESNDTSVFLQSGTASTIQNFPGAASTGAADLNDLDEIVGGYINFDSTAVNAYLETSGPFAYVTDRTSSEAAGSVLVIDMLTGLLATQIQVGVAPLGIAASPDGTRLYVANSGSNTVSVISTSSNTVIQTIGVGNLPTYVAVNSAGTFAYVTNQASNTVSVINTATFAVVATIPVGNGPTGVAVTPNGAFVYVTNNGLTELSNTVSVIDASTNAVSATITTPAVPIDVVITPDGAFAYVVSDQNPGVVSVINTATNTISASINVGVFPITIAISPDGTKAYVGNVQSHNLSVIDIASNTVTATINMPAGKGILPFPTVSPDNSLVYVAVGNSIPIVNAATDTVSGTLQEQGTLGGVVIPTAPAVNQTITQPLSPTAPNVFNFGTNNFTVQYPPGTSFSDVNMTVNAVEITEAQFSQRVAGTQFASSTCIVYGGAGGNCVDYKVTCSNTSGTQIPCPSEAAPTITVQTSFNTLQPIVNPGFLTTPIGENDWTNIFTGFSDPSIKGRTKGFSEFVAVDLGASNAQGLGTLSFLAPLETSNPRVFGAGTQISVAFQLASLAKPSQFITDADANLTLEMIANAAGQGQSTVILALTNPFHLSNNTYTYELNTSGFAAGTYVLTVYGNAFAAEAVQFTIKGRSATNCTIESSSPLFSTGETLTFTGIVQPASASSVTPTGTATFYDSGYSRSVLGTATLNAAGKASIKRVLTAPPDRQWMEFTYSGDNNFLPCASQEIPEDYSTSK